MSLVRLLTTGKSLVGVRDESRYHVTNQRLLPKFGSAKNPFGGAPRTAEPAAETAAPVKTAPAPRPPAPLTSSPSAAAPAPLSPLRVSPPPARSGFGSLLARLTGWLKGANRSSKQPQSAIPRFNGPVQTELRLESIKVVRNDLSDSDLEVVSTKPAVAPAEKVPASPPEAKLEARSPRRGWGQVSSRLFSAGKTLR